MSGTISVYKRTLHQKKKEENPDDYILMPIDEPTAPKKSRNSLIEQLTKSF